MNLADTTEENLLEVYMSDEYLDNLFVNDQPLNHEELVELYVNKSRRKEPKEEVILDPGVVDREYSPFELMFSYLMRLNLRFRPSEIKYLEQQTNVPVCLFNKDGGSRQRWLSISQCQKLIKAWRKTRNKNQPIMKDEELTKLESLAENSLMEDVNISDRDFSYYVCFSEDNLSELPSISGCVTDKSGQLTSQPFTIDTAASSSILPHSIFKKWGYKDSELDTEESIVIATACSKGNTALGKIMVKVFLRGANGKYYSLMINFLVMKSSMKRVLIGINDLRKAKSKWDSSGPVEKIFLYVKNSVNKNVRKAFPCFSSQLGGSAHLLQHNSSISTNPTHVRYISEDLVNIAETPFSCDDRFKLHSVNLLESKVTSRPCSGHDKTPWPEKITHVYQAEISSDKTRPACPSLTYKAPDQPKEFGSEEVEALSQAFEHHLDVLAAEKNLDPDSDLNQMDSIPDVPDLNKYVLDMAGVGPPDPEVKVEDEWFLPDMSGLTEFWKDKYKRLFYRYRDNFSKSKYDFVRSKLPPVEIELKDDAKPAYEKPRRHGALEMILIDDYIANLVKAGHVRELTETSSPYNHCLVLVYRQEPGNKVFISSKADRANLSNEERLELLRKSSRLCADMRNLNRQCKSVGGMYLSRFNEVLPAFSQRVLSSLDIKSGYNILELTYESSLYTAFVHRNKQYVWRTLPQGLVQSPNLFVRRLSQAINESSYNLFAKEINLALKNKEKQDLLVYECDPEGNGQNQLLTDLCSKYPKASVGELTVKYRSDILSQYQFQEVLTEGYNTQCEAYLDDILTLTNNNLDHFYMWYYLMKQFDYWKIKIAAAKVQLMGTNITFLGYDIDVKNNRYGLTCQRKTDFHNWKMPTSRATLLSRLCISNYFSNVILSLKVITQCLFCLVNSKEGVFHVQEVHSREFQMLKLAIELNSSFHIPDLRYPAIYSSDASFSALSGTMMQFLPEPKEKGGFKLHLVAQFSKKFSAQENSKCPLYKEILGCLATLREFEHYIRNSTSTNLLFSDASSLSMVTKLQHVNSRLHSFSVYLSSFPNLFLFWSPSSRLNFLCDYITKQYCGQSVRMIEAIPQRYLENIENIKVKKTELISPKALHSVLQARIPDYFSDIPERRKQAFDPLFDYEDFLNLLNQPPIEEQYLKGLLYGYESLPSDSVAFQRQDKQGLISREEFNKMFQKSSGSQVQEHFKGLLEHSAHVCMFDEILPETRKWVALLIKYIEDHEVHNEPSLLKSARHYLQVINPDLNLFRNLVVRYQDSSLYNSMSVVDEMFPVLFIHICQNSSSKCTLWNEAGSLVLGSQVPIHIQPGKAFYLKVDISLFSRYLFSVTSRHSDKILFHPHLQTFRAEHWLEEILMYNNSFSPVEFKANEELFRIKCHRQIKEECRCSSRQKIKYIVESPSKTEGNQEPVCEVLFSSLKDRSIFFANRREENISSQRTLIFLAQSILRTDGLGTKDQSVVSKEIDELIREEDIFPNIRPGGKSLKNPSRVSGLPAHLQVHLAEGQDPVPVPGISVTPEDHNSIILAGLLVQRGEVFTPALVKNLQATCPHLTQIKEQLKSKEVHRFRLTKGILYYENKWKIFVLCLDRVSMSFIISSVHGSHRHYSDSVMFVYLSSYFYCKELKQCITEQRKKCAVCVFNLRCAKRAFVNNPSETEPQPVFSRVYSDVDEFWPRVPGTRKKFLCLFVCGVSHYVIAYSMKSQTSTEICQIFEDVIKNFGVCKELTTDFASMYRSQEFRDLLFYYNIQHRKWSPSRSEENGSVEVAVKEFRRTYMNLLLSIVGNDTKNWDRYLAQSSLLFNSQAIHASVNNISRFNLFFNSNRYSPPWTYSRMIPEGSSLPLEAAVRQQLAFNYLFEKRQKFREQYNTLENPFEVGQYCCKPLGKGEFQTKDESKGAQNTVQNIWVVTRTLPNSCELRSILDGGECVQNLKGLRPLQPTEVKHLFGRVLTDPGSFSQSLFRPGHKDDQIFKKLDKLTSFRPRGPGLDKWYPKNVENTGENVENDLESASVDVNVDVDSQEEGENDQEINQDQDQNDVSNADMSVANVSHPYHLRSRTRQKVSEQDLPQHQHPDQQQLQLPDQQHQQPQLQPEQQPSEETIKQRLRPKRLIKYSHLTKLDKKKKLKFSTEIELKSFDIDQPVRVCLSPSDWRLYSGKDREHQQIQLHHYIPESIRLDPVRSRREAVLLLMFGESDANNI